MVESLQEKNIHLPDVFIDIIKESKGWVFVVSPEMLNLKILISAIQNTFSQKKFISSRIKSGNYQIQSKPLPLKHYPKM